jgi:predicted RNase H-like HicB family nuclease
MTVKATEYLKQPYGRVVVPEDDGTFRAEIVEFPGCIAVGDTAAEALANLESVAESWLQATIAKGLHVPEPIENTEFSGKLVVRLPKTLHKKAAHAAAREGVSLNQFIVSCIAEQVGARSAEAPGPIQLTQAAQPTSLTGARSRSGR